MNRRPPPMPRNPPGQTWREKEGYLRVRTPDRPGKGWEYEHRLVMEASLGRELRSDERVHHKDGQRDNNVPANLELWIIGQPPGQRVEDALAWARDLIARYPAGWPT